MRFWNLSKQNRRPVVHKPLERMNSPALDEFGRLLFTEPDDPDLGLEAIDPEAEEGIRVSDLNPSDLTPHGAGTADGLHILQRTSGTRIHHHDTIGLRDDDHTEYHNDTRGDLRYYTQSQLTPVAGSGVLDHDQSGGRYYDSSEYIDTSQQGSGFAALPVLTNDNGVIQGNLISRLKGIPPDADDDYLDHYFAGALWVNTATDIAYISVDGNSGVAVWKRITVNSSGELSDTANITLADGTVPFTGTVGGITPVANADLATKLYVDNLTTPVDYVPDSINVTVGVTDNGDVESLWTIGDADELDISEINNTPGFTVEIDYAGVTETPTRLDLYVFYDGVLGHTVNVDIWDYDAGPAAWKTLGQIASGGVSCDYITFYLADGDKYVDGGVVLTRINHTSPGNINHDLCVDYCAIRKIPFDIGT